MTDLDTAIWNRMMEIAQTENRPFSYTDFVPHFSVSGQNWSIRYGTFRNKVSSFLSQGMVYVVYRSPQAQNVRCIQPLNSARLESILQQDLSLQLTQEDDIKLLVIDSIINPYRAEYSGRGMLSQRQSRLNKVMHLLQKIARMYGVAIVITNQVHTSVDPYSHSLADSDRPMGGNVMTHTSSFIIQLIGDSTYLLAKMKKSPCYPEAVISFGLNEGGIQDIPHSRPT